MNPMTWRREHQVALVLGLVLGIVLGLVVGYLHGGARYESLDHWSFTADSNGCPGRVCRRLFNLYSTPAASYIILVARHAANLVGCCSCRSTFNASCHVEKNSISGR